MTDDAVFGGTGLRVVLGVRVLNRGVLLLVRPPLSHLVVGWLSAETTAVGEVLLVHGRRLVLSA
jgi:hypothetical protein